MNWGKVTIDFSNADPNKQSDFSDKAQRLEESFVAIWKTQGSPKDAALLSRVVSDRKDIEYYFTPEAMEFSQKLIAEYEGEEIEEPQKALLRDLQLCQGLGGKTCSFALEPTRRLLRRLALSELSRIPHLQHGKNFRILESVSPRSDSGKKPLVRVEFLESPIDFCANFRVQRVPQHEPSIKARGALTIHEC